ncbi:TetR/AcrR family transcriptional regulator [Nocardioides dongxiaopingii]|uniref:TetR/AcrR family transcriptional regulator n=1 Tax=Nocardioides dongxiaopingii TaxID=2576036 RepID=UPI0010C76E40|nr:TetR/AcrR family transcriptional regulator [Nocardioides dongxiaopingii]
MARYDEKHKQATRARILETAGRRLKDDGIDGSGVTALMRDAGLTNGAFYAHFDSKDDLVEAVVSSELAAQRDRFAQLPPGRDGVEELVRRYLSAEHRDAPAEGCPSAALLDEIVRSPEATRRTYTEGLLAIVDDMEARLSEDGTSSPSRARSLGVYALMIGTLQLARAVTDPALADEVVETGLRNALTLLEAGRGEETR